MFAPMQSRIVVAFFALILAGIAYTQAPAQKTEAVIQSLQYENFSYSTATQLATWNFRLTMNDTFTQNYQFSTIGPAGSIVTAGVVFLAAVNQGSGCPGLPSAPPVICSITFPPGGNQLLLTITSPFPQTCAAQTVAIGPVSGDNTAINNPPPGTPFSLAASTSSLVGGVAVPNVVPANTALCPTPIPNTPVPNTPTPTPTSTPVPVIVQPIPQVFQHVPQGIFNGTRNNTPTPVRPSAAAPATGPVATMPVVRPPSTGDAGLPTWRLFRLNAW